MGALRQSLGHCEQLEDFPGEVGAPRHRVTSQSWGRPRSVTPQSWGHLCVTPMVSDPKAGDTPQCHTPKLGTPRQCHISKLGHLCVPPTVSHPKVGDAPTVSDLKVGDTFVSPQWCLTPKLGTLHSVTPQSWSLSQRWDCPHIPTMASHPKVGDPPLGTHSVRPPLQTALFPWGGGGGHPLFLGLSFIS